MTEEPPKIKRSLAALTEICRAISDEEKREYAGEVEPKTAEEVAEERDETRAFVARHVDSFDRTAKPAAASVRERQGLLAEKSRRRGREPGCKTTLCRVYRARGAAKAAAPGFIDESEPLPST
ncbi:hypothetical protein MTO96_044421 [Rhipicephalus appendiculatus]